MSNDWDGRLHYNSCGHLVKINAVEVEEIKQDIKPSDLGAADLRGDEYIPDFSPMKYLDDIWGKPDA